MQIFKKIDIALIALNEAKSAFLKKDYVTSTILAGAAQRLVRDICESRNIEPTIKKISNNSAYSKRQIHNLIARTYNKMKHADHDPEADVEISPDEPLVLIRVAATDLLKLKVLDENSEIVEFLITFKQSN